MHYILDYNVRRMSIELGDRVGELVMLAQLARGRWHQSALKPTTGGMWAYMPFSEVNMFICGACTIRTVLNVLSLFRPSDSIVISYADEVVL